VRPANGPRPPAVRPRCLHSWNLAASRAVATQRRLAGRVRERPIEGMPRLVAGIDCGYSRSEDRLYAAAVLCRLPRRTPRGPEEVETVEEHVITARPRMPYVPGLLSFRELPPVLECLEQLALAPEAVLVDGHGRAHPRRLGIASHLGLLLGIPTVGCAKSILVGAHRPLGRQRGSRRKLVHRGETVGLALRTRDGVTPVYVSVGHLVDLAGAARLVLASTAGFRLPEPARRAHHLATLARLKDEGGR
jgi:deoxyribonuclease V